MEVLELVIGIVATTLEVDKETVKPDDNIRLDLGADSLDLVNLFLGVEKQFLITIFDRDVKSLETPASIAAFVEATTS